MNSKTMRIGREGEPTNDGRVIELGSLRWPLDPVPVTRTTDLGQSIVGYGNQIERGEHGWVTARITLLDSDFAGDEVIEMGLRDATVQTGRSLTKVTDATILYLRLGTAPCWEGMDHA